MDSFQRANALRLSLDRGQPELAERFKAPSKTDMLRSPHQVSRLGLQVPKYIQYSS